MKVIFIESSEFTEWVVEYLDDEGVAALQRTLLNDPDAGDVMPGCGGLRKLRVGDPRRGKGKRGGARVIYLHVEGASIIHLITIYGKNQKDDLSAEEKRLYRQLAQVLKQQSRHPERE